MKISFTNILFHYHYQLGIRNYLHYHSCLIYRVDQWLPNSSILSRSFYGSPFTRMRRKYAVCERFELWIETTRRLEFSVQPQARYRTAAGTSRGLNHRCVE